jgi:uncharacterized membrane protein
MRIKALWFLLVASLALNVFFVAGVLYPGLTGQANTQRERPDPVAQATRDFALDDRQVAALEALRAGVIERREARRDEGEGFRSLIVEALRQPDFDREALDAALQPPAKGYVLFETGYGPSGLPHIGTFGEVARTTMVRQAFER